MDKVPLSNSFLERRDARGKISDSLGAGASLAPCTRPSADLTWIRKWLEVQAAELSELESVEPELGSCCSNLINKYWVRYDVLGRDNLRSHFVFRPRHAPEWLRAQFLPVVFLANEEELTGKTFTTSLNTTNPNTHVKFIFLRTSPLITPLLCSLYWPWDPLSSL